MACQGNLVSRNQAARWGAGVIDKTVMVSGRDTERVDRREQRRRGEDLRPDPSHGPRAGADHGCRLPGGSVVGIVLLPLPPRIIPARSAPPGLVPRRVELTEGARPATAPEQLALVCSGIRKN